MHTTLKLEDQPVASTTNGSSLGSLKTPKAENCHCPSPRDRKVLGVNTKQFLNQNEAFIHFEMFTVKKIQMETTKSVIPFIHQGDCSVSVDIKDAYLNVHIIPIIDFYALP